ncbi:YciI family protein [Kangiella marina]|uniref:YCII-related domain-containing protein n=1 Tax=Kangiella marina TaxID=1079178 RepID=A0ABP8IA17_9GAMM
MSVFKSFIAFVGLMFVCASYAEPYDAELAKELDADDYGMKSYVLVILKTGENDESITDKEERAKYFRGHFDNMKRLADEGMLVLAGPLAEDAPKRGLFIFNVDSLAKAEALVKTDPAVKAGIFTYSLTKFYGSAALMKVNDIHKKIQKKPI